MIDLTLRSSDIVPESSRIYCHFTDPSTASSFVASVRAEPPKLSMRYAKQPSCVLRIIALLKLVFDMAARFTREVNSGCNSPRGGRRHSCFSAVF